MRTLAPLHETPGFPEAFANALAQCEASTYVVANAYTHAPITPYAPMSGRMGIAADVARDMPGMTALRVADVHPDRRAAFADSLDHMARMDAAASDNALARWEEWRAKGNAVGMENALKRANSAAEESDRASDRAFYVRRAAGLA